MLLTAVHTPRCSIRLQRRRSTRRPHSDVRCFRETDDKSSVWADIPLSSNYSVSEKQEVLQRAEAELSSFCSQLPDDHDARKCWEAHDYLQKKHSTFLHGCAREVAAGSPAQSCQQLEELDQMVRELEMTGSVENVYHILNIMQRVESDMASKTDHAPIAPREDTGEQLLLTEALQLFDQVDANHDGKIDASEFESAMTQMSKEVAQELEVIFDCLDAHGSVDKEQFVDIILAEKTRLQNPDSDAEFLKRMVHYHPHSKMV